LLTKARVSGVAGIWDHDYWDVRSYFGTLFGFAFRFLRGVGMVLHKFIQFLFALEISEAAHDQGPGLNDISFTRVLAQLNPMDMIMYVFL